MKPTLVFVDLRPLFQLFSPSPFCIVQQDYLRAPDLFRAINEIGLMTIFKAAYLFPADRIDGDAAIWQYLEYSGSPWLDRFLENTELLAEFENFLNTFTYEADQYLRKVYSNNNVSIDVDEFVIENAYNSMTALMIANETWKENNDNSPAEPAT